MDENHKLLSFPIFHFIELVSISCRIDFQKYFYSLKIQIDYYLGISYCWVRQFVKTQIWMKNDWIVLYKTRLYFFWSCTSRIEWFCTRWC